MPCHLDGSGPNFSVSTLLFEHRLSMPHDLYQAALLVYVVALGAVIAWLLDGMPRAVLHQGHHEQDRVRCHCC